MVDYKNTPLRRCQNCGEAGTEDEGPSYEHGTGDNGAKGTVRVACTCGEVTGWCVDMDSAWEAWAGIQAEAVARNNALTSGERDAD